VKTSMYACASFYLSNYLSLVAVVCCPRDQEKLESWQ
jgi:hypothetical protein